jgi:hypothetical protein
VRCLAPILLVATTLGCSRAGAEARPSASVAARPAESAPSGEAPSATASAVAVEPPHFPPPPVPPPFADAALPGDGEWSAMPVVGVDTPLLYRTILHLKKADKAIAVYLMAFDFARVELHLLAGTQEPINANIPRSERPGLMPAEDAARLIVTTNGGWLSAHGHHGMRVGKDLFVPPVETACTMALTDKGKIRIGTWSHIKGDDASFVWWRQNVPCLVENGVKNPETATYDRRKWGSSQTGEKDVRRSAYAISKDGAVLYFAIGNRVDPEIFADALVAADVEDASQFDINYAFTRFIFFDHLDAKGHPVGVSPLMKDMTTTPLEGWANPAVRDLFYILRR